jgi:ATP-binding cassette, subfamily F, member 2
MAPKNKSKKFLAAQKVRDDEQKSKSGGVGGETVDNSDTGSTITVSSNGSGPGTKKNSFASLKEVGEALPVDMTRSATGVLHSIPTARDIKIGSFSLNYHGKMLVEDAMIELTVGRRYGLIGRNGCGKSTFLKTLAAREVPVPEHIDIYLLSEEAQPSNDTALEYVVNSAKEEVARLENQTEHLLTEQGPDCEFLQPLYDRMDELDPATFESRASTILCGLGFNSTTMKKRTCDMSGGWRMRVALARALFIQPTMLLLDEPTNHLDLNACVWLEEYLKRYDKILVIVSHSQDFLDGVCTDTMVMQQKKLKYWGGNYSTYLKTRREQDVNQLKMYKKQHEEIKHIKQFIASCGTYSNLVRQAKSRQKQLDKMAEAGLLEPPFEEILFKFRFPSCGTMAPPLISFTDVAFSYSGKKQDYLYTGLSFGIDSESRVSIVGPNGAGKSTLLNLMVHKLTPSEGSVSHKSGLRVGRYHQHTADQLDFNISPIEYLRSKFPGLHKELQGWRGEVGKFGITGDAQLAPIGHLSDGMKTRLAFAEIGLQKPHILLLDEPTNAFDMEGIDALAEAINEFEGGVVLVSHDFRLLSQVAREIWVVDHGLTIWDGDISSYKESLKKGMKW